MFHHHFLNFKKLLIDKYKKIITVLIVLLVIIIGLYLIIPSVTSPRTITVLGYGEVEMVPNIASFSFTIKKTGESVATAHNRVAKIVRDVTTDLTDNYGILPTNLDFEYASYPEYNSGTNDFIGYTVEQKITIETKRTKEIKNLIENISKYDISDISEINFVIADEKNLEARARSLSISNAQNKARSIASQVGLELGDIVSINEVYSYLSLEKNTREISETILEKENYTREKFYSTLSLTIQMK